MKRLLVALWYACLLGPLALAQGDLYIGVVTYNTDAQVTGIADYGPALMDALQVTVDLREVEAALFCARNALSDKLSKISHWVTSVEALEDILALYPDGIAFTPPPMIAEAEAFVPRVQAALDATPVAFVLRGIPGLHAPVYGPDAYGLGVAWAASMGPAQKPFAVIGYFDDPLQADLLEGLKSSPAFREAYHVTQEYGKAEATQAVLDHPDLEAIIVADLTLVSGVLETTGYLADDPGRVVKVASLGAPVDWQNAMFDKGLLHGFVSWDHYAMVRQATEALKRHALDGTPLEGAWTGLIYYDATGQPTALTAPYENVNVLGGFWE